ncbi:unnamed protein product [Merluccius merluccius]
MQCVSTRHVRHPKREVGKDRVLFTATWSASVRKENLCAVGRNQSHFRASYPGVSTASLSRVNGITMKLTRCVVCRIQDRDMMTVMPSSLSKRQQ